MSMNLNNMEVRKQIEQKRLRYYEVAEAAGIAAQTFSVWMRTELTPERKERVQKAIDSLS